MVWLARKLLDSQVNHRRVDRVYDGSQTCLIYFFTLAIQEDILAENYRLSGHPVGIGRAKFLRSSLIVAAS